MHSHLGTVTDIFGLFWVLVPDWVCFFMIHRKSVDNLQKYGHNKNQVLGYSYNANVTVIFDGMCTLVLYIKYFSQRALLLSRLPCDWVRLIKSKLNFSSQFRRLISPDYISLRYLNPRFSLLLFHQHEVSQNNSSSQWKFENFS